MAILTNPRQVGETGITFGDIVQHLAHIEALILAMSAKIDNDAGITGTDYEARAFKVLVSGAAPIMQNKTFASVVAEYRA